MITRLQKLLLRPDYTPAEIHGLGSGVWVYCCCSPNTLIDKCSVTRICTVCVVFVFVFAFVFVTSWLKLWV